MSDNGDMEILRASVAHFEEATALLDEYYAAVGVLQPESAETIRSLLGTNEYCLWIAYLEGAPAGCVVLRPLPSVDHAGECKRLYVRPRFRRRGIAEALLDALEAHAGAEGIRWVYLDSKDDLDVAIRMYKKRGYQPCEPYNQNPQATIYLRRPLTAR